MEGDPRVVYQERIDRFRDERKGVRERIGRTRRSRLVSFFLLVVLFLAAEWTTGTTARALFGTGVLATVGFVFLVARHRRLRDEEAHLDVRVGLNEEALARCERRWEDLPPAVPASDTDHHPYAEDLDIVGPVSVERLLSTVSTGPGARTIRSWLLAPAPTEEIRARQEAVEELSKNIDFRQELAARARVAGLGRTDLTESFLAWAEEKSWLEPRWLLLWTGRAVPLLTLVLFLVQVAGWVDGYWWLLGPLAGLIFLGVWTEPIGEVIDRVSAGQRFIGAYGDPLELLEEMEARSERLERVRGLARSGEGSASRALKRLERWITTADVRYNHLIHVPLQVTLFWDVHVLRALEKWRARNGGSVASWLQAVGEAEALAALAALRADNPEWCFPELSDSPGGEPEVGERIDTRPTSGDEIRSEPDSGKRVVARGLGHPLIPPKRSVTNDVELGPPETFLLVTGSNMSGKSTLLRSIGVNCVLGLAGGPVCASELRLPRVRVLTSMRTEDSLARGLSGYMAELRRVAFVVEGARQNGKDPASRGIPLYLLDEPLQGTNEAERREAVRIVLEQLLDAEAIGAVATHDLRLHHTRRLEDAARPVHFTSRVLEEEGDLRLTFDYRLRDGPATSTNALDLLRLVGLGRKEET